MKLNTNTRRGKKAVLICLLLSALLIFPGCAQTVSQVMGGIVSSAMGADKAETATAPDDNRIKENELTIHTIQTGVISGSLGEISVTAHGESGGLIPTDSYFNIECSGDMDIERLQRAISITPNVGLKIFPNASGGFKVVPERELAPDTVYRITICEYCDEDEDLTIIDPDHSRYSYAFQTGTKLAVKETLPADTSTEVPTNTGIEVTFTMPVTSDSVKDGMKVYTGTGDGRSAVEGEVRLYPDCRTAVFIPSEYLEGGKAYYLEISEDITSVNGERLGDSKTVRFRTGAYTTHDDNASVMFNLVSEAVFAPGVTNKLEYQVYCWSYNRDNRLKHVSTSGELFKYPSFEAFTEEVKKAQSSEDKYIFPTEGLSVAARLTGGADESDKTYSNISGKINIPKLERGAYLANVTVECSLGGKGFTFNQQVLIQVTSLNAYTEAGGGMLLWVMKDGRPAASASVTAEFFDYTEGWGADGNEFKAVSAVTDENGIAVITESEAAGNTALTVITSGEDILLLIASLDYADYSDNWMYFLFTDRETYFADDTVNFRGIIAPKTAGKTIPDRLFATLGSQLSPAVLEVAPDGSFSGSISYEAISSYGMRLRIYDADDNTVISKYISVTQEDKPVYRGSISFDRLFYRRGDTATLTISAAFYDGTPAPGLTFNLTTTNFINNGITLTTDEKGEAVHTFKTKALDSRSTRPQNIYAYAELIGEEESHLYLSADTKYFNSDYVFSVERIVPEEGQSYSEVRLNNLDTSKLLTEEDFDYKVFPDNTIGSPASGKVDVRLIEYKYVRTISGTRYDPISKTTSQVYNFRVDEKEIESYTADINGTLRLEHVVPEKGFEGYYRYEVVFHDEAAGCSYKHYSYATAGSSEDVPPMYGDGEYQYYELKAEKERWLIGETVKLNLLYGSEPSDPPAIYTINNVSGRSSYGVTAGGSLDFEYTDSLVGGCTVFVTVWDGSSFLQLNYTPIYDYEKGSALNISLTPDAESYRPGGEVKVDAAVTDIDGKPVSGASVTLSMVDQACFALGEQNIEPLDSYYLSSRYIYYPRDIRISLAGSRFYGGIGKYNTVMTRDMGAKALAGGMAEPESAMVYGSAADIPAADGKGGGSGEIVVRESFLDNPLFETAVTDETGIARFAFKAPDNITEWRLTAAADCLDDIDVKSSRKLGAVVGGIICTLPFFVNAEISELYVTGDSITASARVYGSKLEAGSSVSYTVKVEDGSKTVFETSAESAAGEYRAFTIGDNLKNGNYTVTITAVCGEYSDAVKLPFTVADSGLITDVRRTVKAGNLSTLKPVMYPVTLSFISAEFAGAVEVISSIMRGGGNSRADSMAANYAAIQLVEKLSAEADNRGFDESLKQIRSELAGSYIADNGLIRLLPYSEGNVTLSAMIAYSSPDSLTDEVKSSLAAAFVRYINGSDNSDITELCAAYLGLSALGRPVLPELRQLISNPYLTDEAKLILAAAFAAMGDRVSALPLYNSVADRYFTESQSGSYFKADQSNDTESNLDLTATALLAASRLLPDTAKDMARYITTHTSSIDTYALQLAAFAVSYYPADSAEKLEITCTADGKSLDFTLSPLGRHCITLDKAGWDSFKLTSGADKLLIYAAYKGSYTEAADYADASDSLKLTKTVEKYDEKRGFWMVKISYTAVIDSDYLCFNLNDRIPSGARYVRTADLGLNRGEYSRYTYAWLYNSAQMMNGRITVCNPVGDKLSGRQTRTVTGSVCYIIRGAFPGSYTVEPAVALSGNTMACSDSLTVTFD